MGRHIRCDRNVLVYDHQRQREINYTIQTAMRLHRYQQRNDSKANSLEFLSGPTSFHF